MGYLETRAHPVTIAVSGVIRSFAGTLAPHHAYAIGLLPIQAFVGLLPHVLYRVIAALLREPVVVRVRLLILGIHVLATLLQRGLSTDYGSGQPLTVVPVAPSIGLLQL